MKIPEEVSKNVKKLIKSLSPEVWTYLILTIVSIVFMIRFVDLTPQVDDNFFFSSSDPHFQSEKLISDLFVRNDTQMIISATGNIDDPDYQQNVNLLSETLIDLDGVTDVKSITHGPNNLDDALLSPLWKRLLISDDKKSSNLILLLEEPVSQEIIPKIEEIIDSLSTDYFKLNAAGLPYVIELIRRSLMKDLQIFSTLAFIVFGFVVFRIFRSKAVLFGTLISCLNAFGWTFMITALKDVPIGILTANLATIIFVLTLSHIIFLTFNWKKLCYEGASSDPVTEAVNMTFPASFWSMLTTLLGFLSLLSVQAKPLKDLGMSGAIGTVVALIVAYGVFPTFLKMARRPTTRKNIISTKLLKTYEFLEAKKKSIVLIVFVACILALPGLGMIDSDPSLLSYFSKQSEMFKGFDYIDRNGGSSPLILVVKSQSGEKLSTGQTYKQLWELQSGLEQHRSVGSVISLPVLMAQAKRAPLAFFISYEWLLDILEQPQYDQIAKSFITEDRQYGLFLLRMNEANRNLSRLDIIDEIKELVSGQGFIAEIFGGVYVLQGHLSKLVSKSLIFGLGKLILLFALISWIISRSIRVSLAMTLSICLIPLNILGLIGIYRIPLDIISAPASNVAIAMGIDSMIHMIKAYRKLNDWQAVRNQLWQPVLTSMIVVATGFAIFLVSNFPPTQRFGLAIVFGTILASLTALYIMPFIYSLLDLDNIKKKLKPKLPRTVELIELLEGKQTKLNQQNPS